MNLHFNFLIKNLIKSTIKIKKKYWEIILGRWLMTWVNHNYFIWDYIIEMNKKLTLEKFINPKLKTRLSFQNTLDLILSVN